MLMSRTLQLTLMSRTLQLTLVIFRATIDLEPKIRTAEENLIYSPKKFFCLYNKLQIILSPFCMTDSFYNLFQIVTCVYTVEHCSAINRLSKASAPTTFYGILSQNGHYAQKQIIQLSPSHQVACYFDTIICLKQIRYTIIKIPNDWKVVMPRLVDIA